MRRSSQETAQRTSGLSRRSVLIGGGAAAGLLVAWGVWPRTYRPNLAVGANETLINAFLKIDTAGQIIVIVPQLEMGQGITTILPQILADELGADWRTIAVQGAPVSPLYANILLAKQFLANDWTNLAGGAGKWAMEQIATRDAMMLTDGDTSLPMFAQSYREAGAAARVLLCKAAAARWDVPWESCDIIDGLVTDGQRRLRTGELAASAAAFALPDILPLRSPDDRENRLIGQDVPRLDLPSKVDGTHVYASDVRLPDMVFASIRQGPVNALRLRSLNEGAAKQVTGFLDVVKQPGWVAATGTNWWAANKALDMLDPIFEVPAPAITSDAIEQALEKGFTSDQGKRIFSEGDLAAAFSGAGLMRGDYRAAPALHLAMEPPCATARVGDDRAEIWVASQAPAFCRRAVARALGISEDTVTLYPLAAGGSFDRNMDHDAAVQAAIIAQQIRRPVQLLYSRAEDILSDRPRPPAHARMVAKLTPGGMIEALSAKISAPNADAETWMRIAHHRPAMEAARESSRHADARAVSGLPGPYSIPHQAVDHYPAHIPIPTGRWRGQADSYTCFFREAFMDELAADAGAEPFSFRIRHLGKDPALARCLTTVTSMAGWQGGIAGSGQGLACHRMRGGAIALMVDTSLDGGGLRIRSILAVVDVGAQPHNDIARQQIEGGIIFGLSAAVGGATYYDKGLPTRAILGRLGLPRLATIGDVRIEFIESGKEPAGVGEIGVPPVAPALAGALFTLTGRRHRALPLLPPASFA